MVLSRESLLRAIKKKGKVTRLLKKTVNVAKTDENRSSQQRVVRERAESWSSEDDSPFGDVHPIVPSQCGTQRGSIESVGSQNQKVTSSDSANKDFYSLVIHRMKKRQFRMLEQCRESTRKNQPTSGAAPVDATHIAVMRNERRCTCEVCQHRAQLRGRVNVTKSKQRLSIVWLCAMAVAKFKRSLWRGKMMEKLRDCTGAKPQPIVKRRGSLQTGTHTTTKVSHRQQTPGKEEIIDRLKFSSASLTIAKGGSAERVDVVPLRAKLPAPPPPRICKPARPNKHLRQNYKPQFPVLQKSKWEVLNSDCTLARNLKGRFDSLFREAEDRSRSRDSPHNSTYSSCNHGTPMHEVNAELNNVYTQHQFIEPEILMDDVPRLIPPTVI
eukprot:TRINITY_DN1201_c0_g2_i1.p1 TRINITY_DN1201_c0_g2~~TRINITY_DN1201_c0_g2_i1.p1  ORF type:complete len:383 (+),score=48.75 TRINITY_DN1201_c0_g2_i1:85-1233(+)